MTTEELRKEMLEAQKEFQQAEKDEALPAYAVIDVYHRYVRAMETYITSLEEDFCWVNAGAS